MEAKYKIPYVRPSRHHGGHEMCLGYLSAWSPGLLPIPSVPLIRPSIDPSSRLGEIKGLSAKAIKVPASAAAAAAIAAAADGPQACKASVSDLLPRPFNSTAF
ncbi:hypothetical protein JDV02_001357 [Purpureocillium takamizusanense]|uniref:Uncharacterized protein n=1 Tax=Purpureocillium takamizusanense TaxID=2060973 RepID=A0A9Q8Q907_9HYPO|nr:uncharacterized protein JDV02_001357 [Purpureocillium takamizusanense]UNI14759.1 hypothetical protein JDV02_001357 [Purpureocillium takamizusanense]